jgi:MoaA/NifB/PqqE/SkfB family radical SAM enzyme
MHKSSSTTSEDITAVLSLKPGGPHAFAGAPRWGPASATSPARRTGVEANRLTRVYVEITTRCNLTCRTCVRNGWDEPLGQMPLALFRSLIEQLRASIQLHESGEPLTLVFAGYGEPTVHPDLLEMLRLSKDLGARVEMVTNGTRVDTAMARRLIDLGADRVWFSVDAVTPERYAAIRRGGQLAEVSDHIRQLYHERLRARRILPEIGLAFVAMRSNVDELPGLYRLAMAVHASDLLVTNLLPHTPDMLDEILYRRSIGMGHYSQSNEVPRVHLPRMDFDETTGAPLLALLGHADNLDLAGADPAGQSDYCPFVQGGATAIRWDGQVSPCSPLLHAHPVFVASRWKQVKHASYGSIAEQPLAEIWASERYAAFRRKVQVFDFAPCVFCGGCGLDESNEEDCKGNSFPVCGGCLWAQGIVRCP